MGRCLCCLPLVAVLGLGITPAKEAEPVKKFPQPGATLPGSFSPLIINGGWKDKDGKPLYRHRSPVAHFGLRPVVLVFARDFRDDVVMDFLKKLEARLEAHPAEDLRAAAIFLCHDDKRQKTDIKPEELIAVDRDLENVISKLTDNVGGLKHVLVGIGSPAGPKGYDVGERAHVMVVLYDKFKVRKSYVYDVGDGDSKQASFDAKAVSTILKEIDEWMASLKPKRR